MRALTWITLGALSLLLLQGCCGRSRMRRCCPPRSAGRVEAAPKAYATRGEKTVWAYLSQKYDRDRDGAITPEEHRRAETAFERLDRNEDGRLTESDFERHGRMDVMVSQMTLMRYFQGDEDPRELTRAELDSGFARHDESGDGALSKAEIDAALAVFDEGMPGPAPKMPEGMKPSDTLIRVADRDESGTLILAELTAFFTARDPDGDGVWKMPRRRRGKRGPRPPGGAAPGEPAPDFTLQPPGGGKAVTLTSFRGKKPVALIFGSYT